MANVLQGCGLLHKHQFRSENGRSATEAALRTVTRAQWWLAKGGAVGWGFWDVKGGIQNVREENVIKELESHKKGKCGVRGSEGLLGQEGLSWSEMGR